MYCHRDHYLQLRVYLEDLMIHKTEHVPQYEWNTIMGRWQTQSCVNSNMSGTL